MVALRGAGTGIAPSAGRGFSSSGSARGVSGGFSWAIRAVGRVVVPGGDAATRTGGIGGIAAEDGAGGSEAWAIDPVQMSPPMAHDRNLADFLILIMAPLSLFRVADQGGSVPWLALCIVASISDA
jgi:hypothetical protein